MRVLVIGDVVGRNGTEFLRSRLKKVKTEYNIDLVIANGENSSEGNGILPVTANRLFDSGVDVITGGNHSFRRREIFPYLNENSRIIRPFNYPSATTPGQGICKLKVNDVNVAVINIMGVAYMESLMPPLESADEAVKMCSDCAVKIVDFHAEATAEKRAMGFYLAGRVSAVVGTHTHVQTSDEEILPGSTGYITDVGMTGVKDSVLGVKKELSIRRMKNRMPVRFENASGACKMECMVFEIDDTLGKTTWLKRIREI